MRTNIYKNKIVELFEKSHLLSISDIHKKIVGADYSTVYRNVEQLVSEDKIKKIIFGKDNVVYEINKKTDNHDHFLCIKCGDVEEIHISSNKLLTNHVVTDIIIRGLCYKCNQI
jgi:Fe2+ or Zn2+ uptake regulation protein